MRRLTLAVALCLTCVMLTGCRQSGEVEHQAYVLVLGVDRLADGRLSLTARVPRIGRAGGDSGDDEPGGSSYLTFSAAGESWPLASEALEQVTPRRMNLSHIEMLVVSEALAAEDAFPELVSEIAETPHLYATARFVVCEGAAGDFVRAGRTVIGTRMSSELNAMLKHYAGQGYIPDSTLADAYYAVNGVYGDALAIHAFLEIPAGEAAPRQRFLGAALLRRGVFVRTLSAPQARLVGLIRGSSASFPFEAEGHACQLTPESLPSARVDTGGDVPRVELALRLSTLDCVDDDAARALEDALARSVASIIGECQRLGAEPFGFAEAAAANFATMDAWTAYGWRERFSAASVEVSVAIRRVGAM